MSKNERNELILQNQFGENYLHEIMIFAQFYTQKLIEYKDRSEIMNCGRRAVKLALLSTFLSFVSNRLLTKIKFKRFDFLNLRLFLRFPIRFGVTSSIFWFCMVRPIIDHALVLTDKLYSKYHTRFELYKNNGDPLIMNPGLLEEPNYSEEERANTLQLIEKIRLEQRQYQMQSKMM